MTTTGCVYLAEKMISGRILPAETMSYCSFEALTSGRKLKCPCSPLLPEVSLSIIEKKLGKNVVRTLNNFIFTNVFYLHARSVQYAIKNPYMV